MTSQSTPTDQTPNGPNQDHVEDGFYDAPLSTPTEQTPNQDDVEDCFYDAPLSTPQGYSQDLSHPPLFQMFDRNRNCSSCLAPKEFAQILNPTEIEFTNLGDGRLLCPSCLSISLMEPEQLKPLIRQVYSFFDDYLKLPVSKDIPIFFVDANQIKKNSHAVNDTDHILYGRTMYRGDTIKIVVGATLVHEMVHALIRLQGWNFILEKSVEESICEAVACTWLEYTADDCDPSYTERDASFAKALNRYTKCVIETSTSYAEFAQARHAVEKYGLKRTLEHVARTRSIPN
ncbi:hypothetical protein Vadar_021264 [Vaccinium darrowii]|uniref:Uncharacterized protein n=1 Tax=Vaccinium darrowii TaxID=229202 RepID=A0ACB7Y9D0_9ERIC|nr:hypothetical protein Vadar_021264 [Vaccinium darrowii]